MPISLSALIVVINANLCQKVLAGSEVVVDMNLGLSGMFHITSGPFDQNWYFFLCCFMAFSSRYTIIVIYILVNFDWKD